MDAAPERLICIKTFESCLPCKWFVETVLICSCKHTLANSLGLAEVAQQSRIRHKEDFIIAFSPVMAEATAIAYKGAPTEVQGKLRRVIEVWKDRTIFEPPIMGAIESRLEGKRPAYNDALTIMANSENQIWTSLEEQ